MKLKLHICVMWLGCSGAQHRLNGGHSMYNYLWLFTAQPTSNDRFEIGENVAMAYADVCSRWWCQTNLYEATKSNWLNTQRDRDNVRYMYIFVPYIIIYVTCNIREGGWNISSTVYARLQKNYENDRWGKHSTAMWFNLMLAREK